MGDSTKNGSTECTRTCIDSLAEKDDALYIQFY